MSHIIFFVVYAHVRTLTLDLQQTLSVFTFIEVQRLLHIKQYFNVSHISVKASTSSFDQPRFFFILSFSSFNNFRRHLKFVCIFYWRIVRYTPCQNFLKWGFSIYERLFNFIFMWWRNVTKHSQIYLIGNENKRTTISSKFESSLWKVFPDFTKIINSFFIFSFGSATVFWRNTFP